ncbi:MULTISPECIES: metal-dependent hydrolase [Mycobacterium]|nr:MULTISPECIES: metal-dependent hydrolase [Mycobacterium]AOS94430.1 metal-dependent hydrolase [Mycobacterium intracellulare subsp. chimaera]ARV85054.1 metal-dependent hydrolase [Mycobacterium intracellulare subsp. chimaera]ASL14708.1 metal-dependent hydrolase [Mycobacterium intracellulare subsp. chimaera]ASL20797.1 metal-dependent hydrolase [Mycobacterium intracellulare subsp. chimaera]ASQ89132.1 metal-dependent hydrolase [Mycobacterium intracellulare subsp. chimaera]
MTNLKVRRVRFDLGGDDIPFNWQPERPAFAMQCNLISFFAPGFEKFVVDATREAIPLMTDPAAIEEANLYLRQEAQHSSAHVRHINALCRRWPGLQQVADDIIASYDELTATKPLDWRLAYTAVVEATFTPYFKVFLDHDDKLFEPADERVASLFMWHFVEEIEHRSSALVVYNAIRNDFRFRAKTIPSVIKHLGTILAIAHEGFRKHVPAEDGGELARLFPKGFSVKALRDSMKAAKELQRPDQATYAGVPKREMLAMLKGLVIAQGPNHDPELEVLPDLAGRWFKRFDEEPKSAAHWYTVGVGA